MNKLRWFGGAILLLLIYTSIGTNSQSSNRLSWTDVLVHSMGVSFGSSSEARESALEQEIVQMMEKINQEMDDESLIDLWKKAKQSHQGEALFFRGMARVGKEELAKQVFNEDFFNQISSEETKKEFLALGIEHEEPEVSERVTALWMQRLENGTPAEVLSQIELLPSVKGLSEDLNEFSSLCRLAEDDGFFSYHFEQTILSLTQKRFSLIELCESV